jgi:hypothetical protein
VGRGVGTIGQVKEPREQLDCQLKLMQGGSSPTAGRPADHWLGVLPNELYLRFPGSMVWDVGARLMHTCHSLTYAKVVWLPRRVGRASSCCGAPLELPTATPIPCLACPRFLLQHLLKSFQSLRCAWSAAQVSHWLRQQERLRELQPHLIRALDCFAEGVMLCDPSRPHWPILYRYLWFLVLAPCCLG